MSVLCEIPAQPDRASTPLVHTCMQCAYMHVMYLHVMYLHVSLDGVPSDVERDHINLEWLVLYGSFSGLGIVFALFCLAFNWSCRKKP